MSTTPTVEGPNTASTRLKKRQRGFHYEREPGFYGVQSSFQDAGKTASLRRAMQRVAEKYALLDDTGEPIEALAKVFAQSNFGYGDDAPQQLRTGDPTWGVNTGMPMETGDRGGLSKQLTYGGV